MDLSINLATNNDLPLINALAKQVFPITYKHILTSEQIEYMMDWMYSIKNLKQQIEENHIYFLAYENKQPCGYFSINQEKEDLFHLQKLYILPQYQGKSYGKKLFEKAIEYVKQIHPTPCRIELNVNRHNKAINFYEKLGMKKIKEETSHIGNNFYMEDYIMAIEI